MVPLYTALKISSGISENTAEILKENKSKVKDERESQISILLEDRLRSIQKNAEKGKEFVIRRVENLKKASELSAESQYLQNKIKEIFENSENILRESTIDSLQSITEIGKIEEKIRTVKVFVSSKNLHLFFSSF